MRPGPLTWLGTKRHLPKLSDKWDIAPDDWGVELEGYGGEGGQGEEDTEEQLRRLKDDFVMPPFSRA